MTHYGLGYISKPSAAAGDDPSTIFGGDLQLWESGLRSSGDLRDTGAGTATFDPLSSAPAPVGEYRLKQINDLSGNSRLSAQLTAAAQPLYDETTGFMLATDVLDHLDGTPFNQTQPYMIAFVLTMPSPSATQVIAESTSGTRRLRAFSLTDDTFNIEAANAGVDSPLTTSALTPGQTYSFITIVDGVNGEVFVDGVSDVTGDIKSNDFADGITLLNSSATDLAFQSPVGEVVMASGVPTAQQIADLAAYFAAEWGI